MSKRISRSNLPVKLPVTLTALVWIYCDAYNVSDITIGVASTLMVIIWIASIYGIVTQETVDLFKEKQQIKKQISSQDATSDG